MRVPQSARERRKLARMVFEREGGACFYCDEPVSMEARVYLSTDFKLARLNGAATVDHIIPQSRGGGDTMGNIVCACLECNTERGDMPAVDFLYMKRNYMRKAA